MSEAFQTYDPEIDVKVHLHRAARELALIRQELLKFINCMHEAESEIPEKIRRFAHFYQDVACICYIYEERGQSVPPYLNREMERCDDRMRQLLAELHNEGGAFERVRRQMAEDKDNRWDHTRQLTNGASNETRSSLPLFDGVDKG